MPFFLLAAVTGGATLLGSAISGSDAEKAAKTQSDAALQAAKIQKQEFDTTTANEKPFLQGGTNALAALMQGLGIGPQNKSAQGVGVGYGSLDAPFNPKDLASTPGYKFEMDQGLQALLDAQTATGGVGGGNTLKAITQYGQGLASTTYQQQLADYMAQQQQQFGNLQTVAGSGQNAAAQLGALGQQSASAVGNDLTSAAAARAAGTVGQGNAINSGLSSLSSNFLLAQLLQGGGGFGGGGAGFSAADASAAGQAALFNG